MVDKRSTISYSFKKRKTQGAKVFWSLEAQCAPKARAFVK